MPLSWNEIRHNAIRFSNEWTGETREHAEAKTFWDDFFSVFGLRRRTVASFEEPVKKLSGDHGYIDLFWPGVRVRNPIFRPKAPPALADLYDPLSIPPALLKAHTKLDRAVEKCYRPEPFHSDRERVEFLFALYEKLTGALLPTTELKKRRSKKTARISKNS